MAARTKNTCLGRTNIQSGMLLVVGATMTFLPGWALPQEADSQAKPETEAAMTPEVHSHLSEGLRTSVKKVVVLPGQSPASQATTGSYEKETKGLLEGGIAGSQIGKGVGTEIGPVSVGIPFPILTLPGALIGGVSGKTKREIQEFRDRLTDDLAKAAGQPLSNDALASDVFWGLRRLPGLDSKVLALTTPVPDDTDAVLYVSLTNVTIDAQGKEAIITTSANATLRRLSDGEDLYQTDVVYQDRDTLANWTRDENALWRDYANFARHYIGREISAEVFDRIDLRHKLVPTYTDTVSRVKRNEWLGVTKSRTPTLAWELTLPGGDSYGVWTATIDGTDISYDIEIYDSHRLVYSAKQVPDPRHRIPIELDACKTYRWSVRPSYQVAGDIRFGAWMRSNPESRTGKGNVGRSASKAPAYIQDFATLNVKCGRK